MAARNAPGVFRFPWDPACDRTLALAAELRPDDDSWAARYLREVAGSIADHRLGSVRPE